MLTFAIGDIHGCYDSLIELVEKIEEKYPEKKKYVFIGDYIDRGPKSAQVLDWMMSADNVDKVCLMGNHEDMFLNSYENWMYNGGHQAVESYHDGSKFGIMKHREWCFQLPLMHQDKHRYYVHAGFDPFKSIEDQTIKDMLWIREQFLLSDHDFNGKLVVHGHTPYRSSTVDNKYPYESKHMIMQLKPNRLNIDTACVFGGHLTAAVFTDEQRDPIDYLQVANPRRM